ncbi:PRC-barrel domain-containing protein [Aureimonas sp. AU20]|uniref:PRC-barrel domain-containing protein n=1 Tax=Aureimonas sp. AU20 TaxID=1349819 RepID=UPI0007221EDC|nr:PRC-barrel domain-containing protein [Aureimonas sp. AU20]ALN72781.1 hypothetical protein M673_08635 [Aureimonas sp. AU20]
MKSLVLAAGLATLLGSAAFAQTATTAAPVVTGTASNDVIVVLPQSAAGSAPARFLADDLEGEDIYGANNEKIGDIEDFVLRPDGSIEAVVVEVGGFLGIGEKDVLVSWSALQIGVQDNDLRITAPGLTRDILQNAQGVDVDTLVLGRD